MIGDALSDMANAQKLSIAQLQKSVQDGSLPSYIGIPLIQQKTKERQEAMAALQGQQSQNQPPIGEQVMQAADQVTRPEEPPAPTLPATDRQRPAPSRGIDSAQSNLPDSFASGGIVAFSGEDGSQVRSNPNEKFVNDPSFGIDPSAIADWMNTPPGGYSDEYKARQAALEANKKGYYSTTQPSPSKARELAAQSQQGPSMLDQASDWWHQNVSGPASNYIQDKAYNLVMGGDKSGGATPPQTTPAPQAPPTPTLSASDINRTAQPQGIRAAPAINLPQGLPADTTPAQAAPTTGGMDFDKLMQQQRAGREDLRNMILGQGADDTDKLKQVQNMALLRAGLGIMGGRSPFFGVNVGEGAMQGVDAYQKGIEQLDAGKQQRVKQVVDMGLKGQDLDNTLTQLGITKDYYDAHKGLFEAQADLARSGAMENRAQTAAIPAKLALQQAKLQAAGAGGSGGKGYIGATTQQKIKDKYTGDPTGTPGFNKLPKIYQDALTEIKDPSNPSYQKAKAQLDATNKSMYVNDLNEAYQSNRRSTSFDPSQYSLD